MIRSAWLLIVIINEAIKHLIMESKVIEISQSDDGQRIRIPKTCALRDVESFE